MTPDQITYRFFTEVGIIFQLSTTLLEDHLPGRMTSREFGVLGHLVRRPAGRTPLQLAQAFQVPKTSMTHSVAMLDARSLVEIVKNPEDARSKIVRASREASDFVQSVNAALNSRMAPLIQDLGVETFAEALPKLEAIRIALDAERD
ncbi:MAG: MarR family winged helix-turn-helix transcriptional regulator [Pseudomonadota bacterium]